MKKILTLLLSLLFFISTSAQKIDITLEDIWKNYSFYPKGYGGLNSMNDGEHYVRMIPSEDQQKIIQYQFKNGKQVRVLFKSKDFEIPKIISYKFSNNEKQILLATQTESIYRYSKRSIYYVYDITTNKIQKLNEEK